MMKVLFVCTGNICRSPTAEAVFRHMVQQEGMAQKIHIDSAGTHGYHLGEPPDSRAIETASKRGISMRGITARKFVEEDAQVFDIIVAMDDGHFRQLSSVVPLEKLKLFLEFADGVNETEVPDPYYGTLDGFEYVFDLVEVASCGLLQDIKAKITS